jgi:hypothetical protein
MPGRLIGKTKEINGEKDGFILIDSSQGLGCLRIDTIIAIKPGKGTSPVQE